MSKDIRCIKWFTVEGEEAVKAEDEYNSAEDSEFVHEANDE